MRGRNPRFYCQPSADERASLPATGRLFRQPGTGQSARRYVASQERELGRDGRVELLVDGEAVWIGGLVHAVIADKIAW
ncbi:putative PhzF superfamily epimerase YddE/YHI9 [Xanthomonas sp. 3498]|nr:putative PhzF superfamily epimerase YddE/YHI9 [Xanthomonas sp. 3498]